jgi:alpha-tubulin suppressor-like RCC1 family protein
VGKNIVKIFAGNDASMAITNEGRLYYWGNLQLSDVLLVPVLAGGLLESVNVIQAVAGDEVAYVLSSDGRVYSWGMNGAGQVGVNVQDLYVDYIVPVTGPINQEFVVSVTAGENHVLAITASGNVYGGGKYFFTLLTYRLATITSIN